MITVRCPNCYGDIEPHDCYCRHCGAKQSIVFSEPLEERTETQYVVLCHMGMSNVNSLAEAHAEALRKKRAGFEFHYFIDKQGNVEIGRPVRAKGAFAREMNAKAVGVCFAGDLTKETMTDAQLSDDVAQLIWLLECAFGARTICYDDLKNRKPIPGLRWKELAALVSRYDEAFEDDKHRGDWAMEYRYQWMDERCCDFGILPSPFDPFPDPAY